MNFNPLPSAPQGNNARMGMALIFCIALAMLLMPASARAQSFDVPFITEFGCQVVAWLKGPLAVLIFIIVVIITLVVGMIMKMDWGRVVSVTIIFGIITAIGGILANSQYIQKVAGLSACLQ